LTLESFRTRRGSTDGGNDTTGLGDEGVLLHFGEQEAKLEINMADSSGDGDV